MGKSIRIPSAVCVLVLLLGSGCMESDAIREARAQVETGEVAYAEGKLPEAVTAFRRAVAKAPDYLPARLALARSLVAAGEYLEARRELDFVQQREPDNADALAIWAKALALQGRFEEAHGLYTRALASYQTPPPGVMAEQAMILAAMKRHAEALELFERAGESEETRKADILLHWGAALEKAGRYAEAATRYEQALEIAPTEAIILNNLGFMLFRQEMDRERGLDLLETAVAQQPGNPLLLHNYGWALLTAGQYEEAHNLLRRAASATDSDEAVFKLRQQHLQEAADKLERGEAAADAPNVVIIVVDTLRADHLGVYGYERNTSPHIDALGREGVVFEQAISQAPWTSASIASLITGLYPSVHGLDQGARWGQGEQSAGGKLPFRVQKALMASRHTIAEQLRRHGYRTAGFVSNVYVNSIFGFGQGFDVYDDEHKSYSRAVSHVKRRAEETNRRVFRWLDARPSEPFYLFVHYNDPHWPYDPPTPYGEEFVEGYGGDLTPEKTTAVVERQGRPLTDVSAEDLRYIVGLYDGEIQYVDAHIGRLLEKLESMDDGRGLLVILTADHGEEFLDHGSASHGYTLYDEQIHVPLIMRWKGRIAPRRVSEQVRLVDVAPTVLDVAGAARDELAFQGRSLEPLLHGKTDEPRDAYAEASYKGDQRALRAASGRKLIRDEMNDVTEAYDLRRDPGEQTDLWGENWQLYDDLRQSLVQWRAGNEALASQLFPDQEESGQVVLDAQTQDQLEALGYIQ